VSDGQAATPPPWWVYGMRYQVGDMVTHARRRYVAHRDTPASPGLEPDRDRDAWTLLA
jgi:hypothetical protein